MLRRRTVDYNSVLIARAAIQDYTEGPTGVMLGKIRETSVSESAGSTNGQARLSEGNREHWIPDIGRLRRTKW